MAVVSAVYTYPLKSGYRIDHKNDAVAATPRGLKDDRLWMLVWGEGTPRENHHFTQREPNGERLATLRTSLLRNKFLADARGEQLADFFVPGLGNKMVANPNYQSDPMHRLVYVHKQPVQALDAGNDAADWFSDYLGRSVRLVRFNEDTKRDLNGDWYTDEDSAAFSDGGPILIANTASFDQLKDKFNGVAVGMTDFRPNIVIDGWQPWEEDVACSVRIGGEDGAILNLVKPCTRCEIPSIDQETGKPHGGVEEKAYRQPTVALREFRKGHVHKGLGGVFFGQNAAVVRNGDIKTGMSVEVLDVQPMYPAIREMKLRFGLRAS